MKNRYKVFDKGFNKVLDLIESSNLAGYECYKRIIDIIPDNVLDAISNCDDFATETENYNVDFMRLVNAVSLDFTNYKKYLRADVYVHRLFEEDLFKQELNLKIFSVNIRNTPIKQPNLEFYYEEKDGKYEFKGTNDKPNEKNLDLTFEIYLENRNDEFYLVIKDNYRGLEVPEREIPITFDELMNFIENEDEFEDGWDDVEFDADFEV